MDGDGMVGSAELLTDVRLGYSARFPSAIEMFELFPGKSGLGLITEDKVAIGHRRVPLEVPRLADLEVSAEHTSELQSPMYLVFRLLLEKKNLKLESKYLQIEY